MNPSPPPPQPRNRTKLLRAKGPAPSRSGTRVAARHSLRLPDPGPDHRLTEMSRRWLQTLGCEGMADKVRVIWNARLQTTAGTACIRTGQIELNPRLYEIGLRQVQRTLRHEVAHLVAHHRAGRRSLSLQTHGPEWRKACAELGIADEPAFHDLPFERRRVARKYAYQCPVCRMVVERVRKFERHTACYRCCQKYNSGIYHPKYQFQRIAMSDG